MRIRTPVQLLGGLVLIATSLMGNTAVAATAQDLFDSGNAAFESGDYPKALTSYNDAMLNGKNSPRLFYNMGLTHYRLGQYSQAKSAFTESAKDDGLAALSYYHLGVLSENDGDSEAAAAWFEKSHQRAESSKLQYLSGKALETVNVTQSAFKSNFSAGFGYDSNAFRAPNEPYLDVSDNPPRPIVPIVQAGAYIPIRINASYNNPVSRQSSFIASYRLRGDYHTDTELKNADQTDNRLRVGMERNVGRDNATDGKFSFAATLRDHAETYFDRDDGLDRFDDGFSIADRYKYQSLGVEANLKNRIGRYRYELEGRWEQRDYEDVPTASSYDLTNYWVGGAFKIPLTRKSRLKFGYKYYVRDFDERHSRDEDGNLSFTHPPLTYTHNMFEIGVRHRFNKSLVTELIYVHTIRDDEFVGYNDYEKDKIRLAFTFGGSGKFAAALKIDYRDQQYPNAFAFDNPTQPPKEYQEFQFSAKAVYRFTDRFSLRGDIKQEAIESSDPRGEYDRTLASVGVNWAF